MTALVIDRFGGIAPRYDKYALPAHGAQVAQDARLHAGVLKGFRRAASLYPQEFVAPDTKTIFYELSEGNWLSWTTPVDVVLGPVADSLEQRRYYYTGDGAPKKTDAQMVYGNMLLAPSALDNAAWTKGNATIVANATTAPNGLMSADRLVDDAVNTTHAIVQNVAGCTAGIPYAMRVRVKADTLSKVYVVLRDSGAVGGVAMAVDLTDGSLQFDPATTGVTGTGASYVGHSVEYIDDGWYLLEVIVTFDSATTLQVGVFLLNAAWSGTYIGTGQGLYVWNVNLTPYDVMLPAEVDNAWLYMGVPAPLTAPTVGQAGGSGISENHVYVITYVSEFSGIEEESAPSPPVTMSSRNVGSISTVTLTWTDTPPTNGYNITKRRIYRSNGGDYLFVKEVVIGGASTTEAVVNADLAEAITTTDFDEPPVDLHSLVSMANGILAGISGNELCFCEPFQPHAWPMKYRQPVSDIPVSLIVVGQGMYVTTEGRPALCTGLTPDSMTLEYAPINAPCMAPRSIASNGSGVLYATYNGAAFVSGMNVDIMSEPMMTQEEWARYNPASMLGVFYDGRYTLWYRNDDILLETIVRTNYLTYSQDFTNAIWVKTTLRGALSAAAVTAPDGTSTALTWTEDGTTGVRKIDSYAYAFVANRRYTFSVHMRDGAGTRYGAITLPVSAFTGDPSAVFDLVAGTYLIPNPAGFIGEAGMEFLGDGWYRCWLTGYAQVTNTSVVNIRMSNSSTNAWASYTGDGTSSMHLWGAQLEVSDVMTDYIPTTTDFVTVTEEVYEAGTKGAIHFDRTVQDAPMTVSADYTEAYHIVPSTGEMYIVDEDTAEIVEMAADTVNPRIPYVWKSKLFVVPRPLNFKYAQVISDYDLSEGAVTAAAREQYNADLIASGGWSGGWNAVSVNEYEINGSALLSNVIAAEYVTLSVYADGALIMTKTVTSDAPFKLPSGFKAMQWEIEVTGTRAVRRIALATTIEELQSQ